MQIINDQSCSWINDLEPRKKYKSLKNDETCDFVIIGAGYTGLSAARSLAKINSDKKILMYLVIYLFLQLRLQLQIFLIKNTLNYIG